MFSPPCSHFADEILDGAARAYSRFGRRYNVDILPPTDPPNNAGDGRFVLPNDSRRDQLHASLRHLRHLHQHGSRKTRLKTRAPLVFFFVVARFTPDKQTSKHPSRRVIHEAFPSLISGAGWLTSNQSLPVLRRVWYNFVFIAAVVIRANTGRDAFSYLPYIPGS